MLATFIHEAAASSARTTASSTRCARDPAIAAALSRLREPAIAIVEPIVERAHADGELRADFDAEDVLITLRMVGAVPRLGISATRRPPRRRRAPRPATLD